MDGRDKIRGTMNSHSLAHLEAAAGAPLFAGMLAFQDRNAEAFTFRLCGPIFVVQIGWPRSPRKIELNLKVNERSGHPLMVLWVPSKKRGVKNTIQRHDG
jgi:hypothetical protein